MFLNSERVASNERVMPLSSGHFNLIQNSLNDVGTGDFFRFRLVTNHKAMAQDVEALDREVVGAAAPAKRSRPPTRPSRGGPRQS